LKKIGKKRPRKGARFAENFEVFLNFEIQPMREKKFPLLRKKFLHRYARERMLVAPLSSDFLQSKKKDLVSGFFAQIAVLLYQIKAA
jgi:hypothetical protein